MLCPGGSWAALIRAVLLCDMGGQDLDERQPVREGPGNQFIGPNYQAANPVRRHCRQRETAVRRVGRRQREKERGRGTGSSGDALRLVSHRYVAARSCAVNIASTSRLQAAQSALVAVPASILPTIAARSAGASLAR